MAADPVLQWVADAKYAEQHTGVPADVLLGLVSVESGGREGLTSSAGAGGLTQFMPGTAREYNVNVAPGNARSQLLGAGRYLDKLGFKKNPELALAGYNAGPGNPGAAGDYPQKVLAAAKKYAGARSTNAPGPASDTPAPAADTSGGELLTSERRSGLLRALVFVALLLTGAAILGAGLIRGTARAAS